MNHRTFGVLLRRALLTAMAAPLGACGGSSSSSNSISSNACFVEQDAGYDVKQTCGVRYSDCLLSDLTCETICQSKTSCAQEKSDPKTIDCSVCAGRCPLGLERPREGVGGDLGEYLANAAYLELASVEAFSILHDELSAHAAPRRLLRGAMRAKEDEVRHGRDLGALARRFGGCVQMPRVSRGPVRSLEAVALENGVEGCVRETYGALVAMRQAGAAADPGVRAAMAHLAVDEIRHAALAWQVAEWAGSRLGAPARRRIEAARAQAVRQLRAERARNPHPLIARELGVPRVVDALAMLDALDDLVWRAAA